jgi:hypothetical protein
VTAPEFTHDGSGLNARIAAAQGCAEQGWRVVPCLNKTKRPYVTWKLGTPQDKSTTDPDQIARWWQQWPDANPALMTGSRSGFFVLDVDGDKGRANLRKLERKNGPLPHTYRVTTGNGEHFYFQMVPGITNRRGSLPKKIDVRGDGGIVLAPGSLHASGRSYTATDPDAPIAPAPDWLLKVLEPPRPATTPADRSVVQAAHPDLYAIGALARELGRVALAEKGSRNTALNTAAFSLGQLVGAGELDEGTVRAALLQKALEVELPEGEARASIDSGISCGKDKPRTIAGPQPVTDDELEAEVAKEARRILVREEARRRVLASRAEEGFRPLRRVSLKEALEGDRPEEPPAVIFGLHRQGYNTTITARYKTGKTTLGANLRSLADGDPFLDRFSVAPPTGRIGLLNYETTENDMLEWLEDSGIQNTDRIAIENLRGRSFSLAADRTRQELIDWCREMGVEVLLMDPHRMAFAGFGKEIDNDDVNRFTATLDEVKAEAGVSDLFLFVHTGRGEAEDGAEHARGATALDDWADQRWVLTKSRDADDDTRFLYADGRLPYVPEFALDYDPATRRLSAGEGNRRGQASDKRLKEVLTVLDSAGQAGANTAELTRGLGISKRQEKGFSALLGRAAGAGHVFRKVGGPGKETRYWLPEHAPEGVS